jgi:hypothetical protein
MSTVVGLGTKPATVTQDYYVSLADVINANEPGDTIVTYQVYAEPSDLISSQLSLDTQKTGVAFWLTGGTGGGSVYTVHLTGQTQGGRSFDVEMPLVVT